jgi:amylosucrase
MPLIYLGDEVAQQNDYTYLQDPEKATDARWVHRPAADMSSWNSAGPETQVLEALKSLARLRRSRDAFDQKAITVLPFENPHLLGVLKHGSEGPVVLIASFSEHPQLLSNWDATRVFGGGTLTDLWTGETMDFSGAVTIDSYAFHCMTGPG